MPELELEGNQGELNAGGIMGLRSVFHLLRLMGSILFLYIYFLDCSSLPDDMKRKVVVVLYMREPWHLGAHRAWPNSERVLGRRHNPDEQNGRGIHQLCRRARAIGVACEQHVPPAQRAPLTSSRRPAHAETSRCS